MKKAAISPTKLRIATVNKSRKVPEITFKVFEMKGPGFPSLDQLRVFLTVVESGSFAAAGRKLKRATSAISYSIANLEQQLGVALFDRERTKKPILTEAGLAVVAEAKTVSFGIDTLRAKVSGLMAGLETEVSLAVDVMLPTSRLVDALQAFETEFPTVTLRLRIEGLGAITQLVQSGVAHIGITGPLYTDYPDLQSIQAGGVELVPVAAPCHPLAASRKNAPGDARNYVQLVLTDRSPLTEGRDYGVLSVKSWRLADLGAKHALLLAGIGWGNLPEPMVHDDLAAGRLKQLDLPEGGGALYEFQLIHRIDTPPRPAAAWLIRRFVEQTKRPHRNRSRLN